MTDGSLAVGGRARVGPAGSATRFEALLARDWPGTAGLARRLAAAARAAREAVPAADPHSAAIRDGAAGVAAPMLVTYVLWILLDASDRGLARLDFLSRDGQVLALLADRLAPRLGLDGIERRYLYASRRAWLRDIAPLGPPEAQGWLWSGSGAATVAALVDRLAPGGSAAEAAAREAMARLLAEAGFPGEAPLGPGASARLAPLLASPAFAASRAPAEAAARARVMAYLEQEDVRAAAALAGAGGAGYGVVDLGWRGTLHAALAGLMADEGLGAPHGYLFGIEAGGDPRWQGLRHGYQFDLESDAQVGLFLPIEDQRAYLEVFCAADHGTLAGYREGQAREGVAREGQGARIQPVLVPGWNARMEAWGLPVMRAAVLAAADALDLPPRLDRAALEAMRPALHALLEAFWTAPDPAAARAWGAFPLDLGEGSGSRPTSLAEPYRASDLTLLLGRRARLKKDEHFWVEGALAMTPPVLRTALTGLRAARSGVARRLGRQQ